MIGRQISHRDARARRPLSSVLVPAGILACLVALLAGCGKPGADALRRGTEELRTGDPRKAATLLEQARRALPGDVQVRILLGQAYARTGDLDAALAAYDEAIQLDDQRPETWRGRAGVLADYGRFGEAAEAYDRVLSLDGSDTESLLALGRARHAAGGTREAVAALHAVIRRGEKKYAAGASLTLADIELDRRNPQAAEQRFLDALAYDPDVAIAHLRLARLYERELGRPADAVKQYRAYLPAADAAGLRAEIEASLKRLGASADERAAATTTIPPTTTAPPTPRTTSAAPTLSAEQRMIRDADRAVSDGDIPKAVGLFGNIAQTYLARGSTNAAVAAWRRAADLDPTAVEPVRNIARLTPAGARKTEALAAWNLVRERAPDDREALRNVAGLSLELGESDGALVALRRLVELEPQSFADALRLAETLDRQLGLKEEAVHAYVALLVRFGHDPRAPAIRNRVAELIAAPPSLAAPRQWPRLPLPPGDAVDADARRRASERFREGAAQQQAGNLDEAVALYLRALAADPVSPETLYNLAICFRAQGAKIEAVACYLSALEAKPDYVSARYNLALLMEEEGDVPGATYHWEKLLELRPNEPAAHLALGRIYARDPATLGKSRQHYARYAQLDPDNPVARRLREWLRATEPSTTRR